MLICENFIAYILASLVMKVKILQLFQANKCEHGIIALYLLARPSQNAFFLLSPHLSQYSRNKRDEQESECLTQLGRIELWQPTLCPFFFATRKVLLRPFGGYFFFGRCAATPPDNEDLRTDSGYACCCRM